MAAHASGPEPTTTHVDSSDGVRLAVHRIGGSGAPLLVFHATGFCAKAYLPLARHFLDDFEVIGVDLRGHGESTSPGSDEAFLWDRVRDDVVAVVDALALSGVRVFGHSMGAAVALMAASAQPGWLAQAFVYEPIIWPAGEAFAPGENPLGHGARKRREVFASRAEAMLRYAARPPFDVVRADMLWHYVTHGMEDLDDGTVRLRCRGVDEGRIYDGEGPADTDAIAGIDVPVTVARGGEAGPGPLADAAVGALTNSRLLVFEHLGHFGPLQDPEAIARAAVTSFRDGVA